ncbi:DUF262 domain-containing protein [Azospirillum argentinense]
MQNSVYLPDDQQEDIEDLAEAGRRYSAVINTADWTVQTIIQQMEKGNIELNPDFQRREAWRKKQKSQFIESLILNVPVPQLVLAERKDKRGKFIVIDGKQRLITLRQFYANHEDPDFKPFKLNGLTARKDLNGFDYKKLSADFLLESDLDALDNSTIRTAVIRNWHEEKFLYTIFLRLNTGSVQLSPQELRQALHPGKFLKFVDDYSISSKTLQEAMHLSSPDARMRDAELIIRYYAFRNFLHTYTGNLAPLLDETALFFNENWENEEANIKLQKDDLETAIDATFSIFGKDDAFRKWNGVRFESALNRAVFDVMILYFINKETAKSAIENKENVQKIFKEVCIENEQFRSSIEGTTKSIHSIYTRLRVWGEKLQELGISTANPPNLVDNKIILASM